MKALFKNRNLSNSVVTLVIRLIGVATLFGLSFLMTNFVDEQYVGYYEFSRVALLTMATFGLIGTDQAILYFAGTLEAQKASFPLKGIYYKMLSIVIIASVLLVGVYLLVPQSLFLSLGIRSDLLHILSHCIYILPFYTITLLNTEAIRAYNKIILSEWFRNILKYVPLLLGVVLIVCSKISEQTLVHWYLYGFIVLAIASFLAVLILSQKETNSQIVNVESTQHILSVSYPMAISSFYTFLLMTIDVFLLGQYYGAEYVAFYAIAMKMMSVLSMVIVAVNVNFAPKISQFFATKEWTLMQENANKSAKFIAGINFVVGGVLLLGGSIILRLFGENYTQALSAYYILIAVQMLVSTFGWSPIYLNMTEKQHLFHKIMGLAVVINLILNLILLPKYDMVGAAISYAITVLFWNSCVAIVAFKKDKIHLTLWK